MKRARILHAVQEIYFFRNFPVEKRREPPYGTRSYLLGGTTWGKTGREEAGCPPVFLKRKVREEHDVDSTLP